jgi:predicted RNA binding protein YcfA (HicA-like mRNA interferase family)
MVMALTRQKATVPIHGDVDFDPEFLDDICKQLKTRLRDLQA